MFKMSWDSDLEDEEQYWKRRFSNTSVFGTPTRKIKQHSFKTHSHKSFKKCAHCGGVLVGVIKKELRCKRCELDVHEKCRELLEIPCIELIYDRHHFRNKTHRHMVHCDHCQKFIVGFVNQGLQCTECGANVHNKCQEKLEISCSNVKWRLQPRSSPVRTRKKPIGGSERRRASHAGLKMQQFTETSRLINPKNRFLSLRDTGFASEPESLDSVPADYLSTLTITQSSLPPSPVRKPKLKEHRRQSMQASILTLEQQVDEAKCSMAENVSKMLERSENLERLQDKSEELEEKSQEMKILAGKIETSERWKKRRIWIVLGIAVFFVLVIIVVIVVDIVMNQ